MIMMQNFVNIVLENYKSVSSVSELGFIRLMDYRICVSQNPSEELEEIQKDTRNTNYKDSCPKTHSETYLPDRIV